MANIQDTSSGKTSPEHFPPTAEKISAVSSKPSVRSKTAAFQFLDLRENGQKLERFWQNPILSHGEFLMHNTGECPSEENGSFLSQILTEQVPEKYYLSPKVTPHSVGRCPEGDRGDGTVRVSGYSAESLRAWQRTAGSAADSSGTAGLCLCDQGGERIDILKERTATLRAEAHHPPCVLENHPADSRLQISENGKVQTLTSRCGTGGGNVPLLMDTPKTLKIRCGKAGGGKGSLIQENKSATLSCNNDQTVFQPKAYGISSFSSNAMLSGNPHSGIYEADTARTLDTSDQSPAKNQGGIAVLESYALQGSMIGRSDQNGPQGGGVNKEVAFTLNATDHHAVYAASTGNFSGAFRETTPTLLARDHKDPSIVSSGYAVRRLTPQECARLQGFPDQWCSDLASENPTEEEIDRWAAIFEEYRKAVKPESRPKSRKMVQKWLQDPYRDAAEYRLWGNGICLNVAVFVLAGIVWADL